MSARPLANRAEAPRDWRHDGLRFHHWRVLFLLQQAVRLGQPVPPNWAIRAAVGLKSDAAAAQALRSLRHRGLVRVDWVDGRRVVAMLPGPERPTVPVPASWGGDGARLRLLAIDIEAPGSLAPSWVPRKAGRVIRIPGAVELAAAGLPDWFPTDRAAIAWLRRHGVAVERRGFDFRIVERDGAVRRVNREGLARRARALSCALWQALQESAAGTGAA